MQRRLNIWAVCIFALGLIVFPAAHLMSLGREARSVCASHACGHEPSAPARHDADHCPVCQLARVTFSAIVPVVAPSPAAAITETLRMPVLAPVIRPACLLPFSCGPPA